MYILLIHNITCDDKLGVVYGNRGGDRQMNMWGMGKTKQYQEKDDAAYATNDGFNRAQALVWPLG